MPTFTPPTTSGRRIADPAKRPRSGAHALWYHYGAWETGLTVWRDSQGVWHESLVPYVGGSVHRVFKDGELISESGPDEGLATAEAVYLGGHVHDITDAEAADLTAAGYGPYINDQSAAETEEERWLDLIRDVGDGGSPTGITFTGGDVTDGVLQANGNVTWVMADFLANLTVDPDDTYGNTPIGPFRNGAVHEVPAGSFTGGFTTTGEWLSAVTQGGLPNGVWWPLTVVEDGNNETWVGCWYNDQVITAANPYGKYVDTHFVKLSIFGTYASHFTLGATDEKFFVQCARRSGSFIYVLGGEFHPSIDGLGPDGYAQGGLGQMQSQQDFTHRLARAPSNNFGVLAGWEYWDGTGWVSNRANAVELRDINGSVINGSAGFAEVSPGLWVMAVHQLVDTHIDVYNAPAPQGPWTPIARLEVPSVGIEIDGGVQVAWHTKVLGHLDAPEGFSVAMMTRWPKDISIPFTDRNIRRYAPVFVVIPNEEPP